MYFKIIRTLILSVTLVSAGGCASFEKQELARVGELPDLSQYSSKPSAFVDLNFYKGLPNENPVEIPRSKEKVKPIVVNAINKFGLFSSYTFDASEKAGKDYTIQIDIYNHGNDFIAYISGFITGFTFGVVPGAATDNFTLVLQTINKEGKVLNKYSNKDSLQTWVGIWFIPVMGYTPDKAFNGTLENQVMTAFKDLVENGVMMYSNHN